VNKIQYVIYNETLVYIILHSAATECKFIADDSYKKSLHPRIIKWKQKRKHRTNNVKWHNLLLWYFIHLKDMPDNRSSPRL